MKHFYTLFIALMASISLMAGTVTFTAAEIQAGTTKDGITPYFDKAPVNKNVCKDGGTQIKADVCEVKNSSDTMLVTNLKEQGQVLFIADNKYITKIVIKGSTNSTGSSGQKKIPALYWKGTTRTEEFDGAELVTFGGYDTSCDNGYYTFENMPKKTQLAGIFRRVKVDDATNPTKKVNKSGANYGDGGTFYVEEAEITFDNGCTAPAQALKLKADKEAVYVGDVVTFSTEGGNGSTITIVGDNGEVLTDGKWTATEGTHTFVASQEQNGEVCEQEDRIELTVLSKNPVEAVIVLGEAECYTGETYVYTAIAENAAAYEWYINDEKQGSDSAALVFAPDAVGDYKIVCKARNDFNEAGVWIASAPFTATVTKYVAPMEDTYIWKKGAKFTGCVENPDIEANANNAVTPLAYSTATMTGISSMGRAAADNTEISIEFKANDGLYIESICTYGKLEEPDGAQISWDGKKWETLEAYAESKREFVAPAKRYPTTFTIKLIGVSASSGGIWWRNALVKLAEMPENPEPPDYTITYDANGGSGRMEPSLNTVVACTFTAPANQEFERWNTAADGKGTDYAVGATVTEDLTLYAIWAELEGLDDAKTGVHAAKIIRNGQMLIEKNGAVYTISGSEVR